MSRAFVMPDLGEGLTEAEVVAWLVAEGDEVAVDQPVVELESAKSVVQLPSPFAGVVVTLGGEVGQVLHAGDVLVELDARSDAPGNADAPGETDASGEADASRAPGGRDDVPALAVAGESAGTDELEPSGAVLIGYGTRPTAAAVRTPPSAGRFGRRAGVVASSAPQTSATPTARALGADAGAGASAEGDAPHTAAGPTADAVNDPTSRSPVISPIVRRIAREHGLDASRLVGTGRDHLVLRSDVERAITAAQQPAQRSGQAVPLATEPPAHDALAGGAGLAAGSGLAETPAPAEGGAPGGERRIALDQRARAAAAHFERSRREIPDATVWLDVDATGLLAVRRELEQATGERFGVTALVARFAVAGLARHPLLNAAFDAERREIVLHETVNLGVAAQTARGLMVPVVHGADGLSLRDLRAALAARADQAAAGAFGPDALTGGTFTLNNYGTLGVDGSAAILNHPEAAMLGVGRLIERPWVVDGRLAVRTVTELTLTFDHRVCDGAEAAAFLTFVAGCIEHPVTLLADL